jgi:hypothetical protein
MLKLNEGAEITSLLYDLSRNVVLIGVSDGRIIKMSQLASTGFLTGNRSVFAQVRDGFGNVSEAVWSNILYALHNKILEILENKSAASWKTVEKPFSADSPRSVFGTFTSPVLWAGGDFVRWGNLVWSQSVVASTTVKVAARVASSSGDILNRDWTYFSGTGATVTRSLDNFNPLGSYIQLMVTMGTDVASQTPEVMSLSASYDTEFATYFFTTKMIMEKNTKLDSGLITGHMTAPQNTEIKFGIASTNTADWHDYTVVELDKAFSIPESFNNKVKIGIKLISRSPVASPVVDEFAVSFGAEKDNLLNRTT